MIGFHTQQIVVWGMKCISYDYDFESDLATKWKALDRPTPHPSGGKKRRYRRKQPSPTDDSEDDDEAPTSKPRDHLSRKARSLQGDSLFAAAFASLSEGSSDEDEEDLYHDADVC